jgi:hypothetical protein
VAWRPDEAWSCRGWVGEGEAVQRAQEGAGGSGEGAAGVAVAGLRVEEVQVGFDGDERLAAAFNQGAAGRVGAGYGLDGGEAIGEGADGHCAERGEAGPGVGSDGGSEAGHLRVVDR